MNTIGQYRTRTTRRALLAGAAAAGLVGGRRWASAASVELRLLCWPEYDDPDATKAFREARDADVAADHVGANDEYFTFLRAGGSAIYDVVTPVGTFVQPLARAGLLQPLDPNLVPNLAGLLPRFQAPEWGTLDGQLYGVPLSWHTYPMIYNAEALPEPPGAWTDLDDPRFKGKIVMTDDVIGHVLTWNRALGAVDPARVTHEELEATVDLLISIKRNLALTYRGDLESVAQDLASGRGWATTSGQEIVPWLDRAANADLRLARPAPGDFSICDCLCVPANAPNPELAHAYIDHMISAGAQASLASALYRGTVTETAIANLSEHARALYQYDDLDAVFGVSPLAGFPPLEAESGEIASYVDWVVAWDRIRFAPLEALNPPTPTPTPGPSPTPTPTLDIP